jgi:aldehyde:ferredoxin oxidoreductase
VHGYHGRYLRIDASTGETAVVALSDDVLAAYVGGVGLGTWIVLRETPDGIDPLDPRAPLAFVFSPLVGSPLTTSAKFAVVAKSPLTQRLNDALSSSHFAIAGKRTGYDAIVVVGRAAEPSILLVEPDGVRIEPAEDLWGRDIPETESLLRERLDTGFRSAVIGPAGERLVRFATISHDGRHAGRGGHGAVMGSKHLKAIAVRGDRLTTYAQPERLVAYARDLSKRSFGPATAKYRELGTVANLLVFNRLGTLPTRNFREGTFEGAADLAPETIAAAREQARESCAACTIGCEHVYARPKGAGGEERGGVRVEYENLFALGPLCGVGDPDVVLEASALCDDLGLDTISAGGTIAFAMEAAERGLLDAPDLRFGNGAALLEMLRAIGSRTGLGELLANGSRIAAAEIGGDAADFAPHVKGLELPGYDPRSLPTMALGFAVGSRGADHNRSGGYQADFAPDAAVEASPESIARAAIETENEAALMDSLILCKFLRGVFEDRLAAMAEMLELVTGRPADVGDLRATADRIVTAKKRYNVRQGWTPAEDTLPPRLLAGPVDADGVTLTASRLGELVRAYNAARTWKSAGWPPDVAMPTD